MNDLRSVVRQAQSLASHGQIEQAIRLLEKVKLSEASDDADDLRFLLACLYHETNKLALAEILYRELFKRRSGQVQLLNNFGILLSETEQPAEAVEVFRRLVSVDPKSFDGWYNLAATLHDLREWLLAEEAFEQAIALNPAIADAHFRRGNNYRELGKSDSAIRSFARASQLLPGLGEASLLHEQQRLCRWHGVEELAKRVVQLVEAEPPDPSLEVVSPFTFLSLPIATTPLAQLRCAKRWSEVAVPSGLRRLCIKTESNDQSSSNKTASKATLKSFDRIRVGYLSSDFRQHPVGYLIPELIEAHDRSRFEIFGYGFGPDDESALRHRIVAAFDKFRRLDGLTCLQAAERIAENKVQILVDLNGYTKNARTRILGYRPAPVQISYLGFPGTIAADFIDYLVVDQFIVPPDQQVHFSEKLTHLPGCYLVNDRRREVSTTIPSRQELQLPEEAIVFCAFSSTNKITPTMFSLWCELLKAVPESVLWLRETQTEADENLRKEAESRHVDSRRLIFAPKVDMPSHLARHAAADLFLDTFPYNQHSTGSDALRMGLPVITLCGETFASRVGGSLLNTLGLSDLIAKTEEQYFEFAYRLASDRPALTAVRLRIAKQLRSTDLFDGHAFARKFEAALERMVGTYSMQHRS
jgi:protein O-GlcNAc transferase